MRLVRGDVRRMHLSRLWFRAAIAGIEQPSSPRWDMALDPPTLLRSLLDAAIAAAQPERCVPPSLPQPPKGRTVVVGAGKAAAGMAAAVEAHWPEAPGQNSVDGLVVTRYGYARPTERIEVVEAAHPVPDAAGEAAARRMMELVSGLGEDDLVLCLISGGGSALLSLPAPGLTLADQQAVTKALLASGAAIAEINCVRKHLSAIKGGRLAAAAHPARVVTLAISDVVGDDRSAIASGPTVADPTTFAEARRILKRYGIAEPEAVIAHLGKAADETPKPGDPRLASAEYRIVANGGTALKAAAEAARGLEVEPIVLGDAVEGEARLIAAEHAVLAKGAASGIPAWPLVFLSGGELTVTLGGEGRGGPNSEYLLALAMALGGAPEIYALAADTDGIDGSEDNAGAVVTPDTLARARGLGLDPQAHLDADHAYGFFKVLGDLVMTGPTGTNVNDFRAVLVAAEDEA
jgi:glycerate 2-kinase